MARKRKTIKKIEEQPERIEVIKGKFVLVFDSIFFLYILNSLGRLVVVKLSLQESRTLPSVHPFLPKAVAFESLDRWRHVYGTHLGVIKK